MLVTIVSTLPSDSDAAISKDIGGSGVHFNSFDESVIIDAGTSTNLSISLQNSTTSKKHYQIKQSFEPAEYLHLYFPSDKNQDIIAEDGEETSSITIDLKITADKFVKAGHHVLKLDIKITDMDTMNLYSDIIEIPVEVSSDYSSVGAYNKFMGLVTNTLPSPFDDTLVTTIISFIIWLMAGLIVGQIVVHVVRKGLARAKDRFGEAKHVGELGRMITLMFVLFGISNCMKIYGVDEHFTAIITDIVDIIFIILIAFIGWKVYKLLIVCIIVIWDKNDVIDDSLVPLFKMLGQAVIVVLALSIVMAILGFDLATIATSAGLVSIAISLGAQSTLNQFFCGLVLMATRPFRIGDKVKLDACEDVLIVRDIHIMETEFKYWLNEEVVRLPNSTVMGSKIINLTKEDKTYVLYDYFDVAYGEDLTKVEEIIMGIVNSHPKVIKDGSKSEPSFRLTSLEASSVRVRASYTIGDHEYSHMVSCQIREAVFRKFRAEGIKVPHNVVDVHVEE